jgi:hypothetical protein
VKLGVVVNPDTAQWGKPLTGVRVLALEAELDLTPRSSARSASPA